jgi:EmrB/QacA subfamily drug resistance transporter
MSALDGSVVNTVLPLMRTELHTSVAAIEWVTAVYLLVVSALLLGVGRAGDLYGHKRSYILGFSLFVVGSVLCALARSVAMLVAMRGLQAVGASMLFANSPAILTKTFPPEQRGRALGAQATMTYLGLTVGPPLGGWLADAFGWPSIFYINLPIGALAISLALYFIVNDRPEVIRERFDWAGAVLFSGGLVSLLVALDQGHAWGWMSTPTLACFAAAFVLLVAFVRLEMRQASPMLDLTLFRNGAFASSTAAALLSYVSAYSVIFVLPFLLVQGRGLSTGSAGLIMAAQPLVMAVVAPISGAASDRMGPRLLTTAGMFVLALGVVLLAAFAPSQSRALVVIPLMIVGLGIGLFTSPNNSALMGAAPRHRQGIAAGVLSLARNLGMVLGVGITGAVFTTYLARAGSAHIALVSGIQASLFVAAGIAIAAGLISFTRA